MSPRRSAGVPAWHAVVERLIYVLAWTSIAAILLIFVFIAREAIPLLWQQEELRLIDLVWPRTWRGYASPVAVWQPVGTPPKYNLVPLLIGSIKVTLMAMLLSAPMGLGAAVYLSTYATRRVRELVKPAIELLAGIPSVVLGFFGLMIIADWIHVAFGFKYRLNGFVAAIVLSVTIVPIIFTVCEDALSTVSKGLKEAAVALGARPHQLVTRVMIPAALPGIAAGLVLGLGRAIGETMVVLMASGNAAVIELFDWSTSVRTVTATIASELGEVPRGDEHWKVLFLLGTLLFVVTFVLNGLSTWLVRALTRRLTAEEVA